MTEGYTAKQIEALLENYGFTDAQPTEQIISLTLSIQDQEDRDLLLEKIAIGLGTQGKWDDAQVVIERIEGAYEKAEAMYTIAAQLAAAGQVERSFILLCEAEKVVTNATDLSLWQQAELLHHIAKTMYNMGAKKKADEVWEQAISFGQLGEDHPSSQESYDASSVLWEIMETLALVGNTQKALEVAKAIQSDRRRDNVIKAINKISGSADG
jgi:tetratricopeptide (TPR) repeat protein